MTGNRPSPDEWVQARFPQYEDKDLHVAWYRTKWGAYLLGLYDATYDDSRYTEASIREMPEWKMGYEDGLDDV